MPNPQWIEPETYSKIMELMPICTVDVHFFNPDLTKTLLFLRNNEPLKNEYFSIGSKLNKNEDLTDAAIRIANEEIGLIVPKDALIFGGVNNEIFTISAFAGIGYHTVNLFFGTIIDDDSKIMLDAQHSMKQWFDVDDKNLHPHLRVKISALLVQLRKMTFDLGHA